jgi:hypothetical protein
MGIQEIAFDREVSTAYVVMDGWRYDEISNNGAASTL